MRRDGFTFLELLVSITILGLVVASVGGLLDSGLKSWGHDEAKLEAEQNVRVLLDTMSQDIRSATAVSVNSTSTTLELFMPANAAGKFPVIRYNLDNAMLRGPGGLQGKGLQKRVILYNDSARNNVYSDDTYPVANYFNNLHFEYLHWDDSNNGFSPVTNLADSEVVKIEASSVPPSGVPVEISTGVTLRGKGLPRR